MKKSILSLIAGAIVALASCSQSDDMPGQPQEGVQTATFTIRTPAATRGTVTGLNRYIVEAYEGSPATGTPAARVEAATGTLTLGLKKNTEYTFLFWADKGTAKTGNSASSGYWNTDDLKAVTNTKKTELLFLALFLRMLKTGGRCACIVPDGVLFGSSKAHQSIRKELIENHQLRAVISMPSGVFKPYAGVSTAVLVFTKTGAGGTDKVWFYDMKADGFSLDDKRTEVKENDIPDIIARFQNLDAETDRKRTEQSFFVPKAEIAANGYDLSINKYKETEYVPVEYPSTTEILADLHELEMEITKGLAELEEMV